jgi:hypothetical protein
MLGNNNLLNSIYMDGWVLLYVVIFIVLDSFRDFSRIIWLGFRLLIIGFFICNDGVRWRLGFCMISK